MWIMDASISDDKVIDIESSVDCRILAFIEFYEKESNGQNAYSSYLLFLISLVRKIGTKCALTFYWKSRYSSQVKIMLVSHDTILPSGFVCLLHVEISRRLMLLFDEGFSGEGFHEDQMVYDSSIFIESCCS